MDKTMNSHNERGKNLNVFKISLKITPIVQNTRFSQLELVANKSLKQAAKNPCDKILKNLSVFFVTGSSTSESIVWGAAKPSE